MNKIGPFREGLHNRSWIIPVLMIILSAIAAIIIVNFDDEQVNPEADALSIIGSAVTILAIIASTTIGLAIIALTISMVLSSRANRRWGIESGDGFLFSRLNQWALGTFLSTFLFCLIVLLAFGNEDHIGYNPSYALHFALIGVISSIVMFILVINQLPLNIQPNKILARLSEALIEKTNQLFEKNTVADEDLPDPDLSSIKKKAMHRLDIKAEGNGYLRNIKIEELLDLASREDILVQVFQKPGDYLVKNHVFGVVVADHALHPGTYRKIMGTLVQGHSRSNLQDPEILIQQISGIASQALSPAANDANTAIAAIDNLTAIFCHLTSINFPSPYRFDEAGKLRLVTETCDFETLIDAGFDNLRLFAEDIPFVCIRMMKALTTIFAFAKTDEQMEAILKHAGMLMRAAERNFQEPSDLQEIQSSFRQFDLVRLSPA